MMGRIWIQRWGEHDRQNHWVKLKNEMVKMCLSESEIKLYDTMCWIENGNNISLKEQLQIIVNGLGSDCEA